MRAALLPADAPLWTATLQALRHDVYHLPAYVACATRWHEAGRALAFVAEEDGARLLLPLIVRRLPEGLGDTGSEWSDAVSPRGYPGLLVDGPSDVAATAFLERALQALVELLCERRIIAAFVRLHPLLLPPVEPLERLGTVVFHGYSVSIDLRQTPEALWQQTRLNHRRDIRRARDHGYVARIDDEWREADAFFDIFRQSMRRLAAETFWHLPRDYFDDLRRSLGDQIHLCIVKSGDEVAAGALLTEVDGIVEYHLAGNADAHLSQSPSKLLIDFARSWARERGNRTLHLAGSLQPDDTLSHFKLGFSPLQHPVYSWRLVANPDAYRQASRRWERLTGSGAPSSDAFFPAYRAPLTRDGGAPSDSSAMSGQPVSGPALREGAAGRSSEAGTATRPMPT